MEKQPMAFFTVIDLIFEVFVAFELCPPVLEYT